MGRVKTNNGAIINTTAKFSRICRDWKNVENCTGGGGNTFVMTEPLRRRQQLQQTIKIQPNE